MKKIKTIDVNAKEWFDKVNGNSYFSAIIVVNFGEPDQQEIPLPFQYGYDNHYEYVAFQELQKKGVIATQESHKAYWRYYQENNIVYRHSKKENCKKRDLKD